MEAFDRGNNSFKVHLFNCDRTYKLDVVEVLLRSVEEKTTFRFSVSKHYFPLPNMAEISSQVAEYQMDFAIFVVHANESRLSINEEKAGIGYAKIYRALLDATGGRVLIVIGGDDNYNGEEHSQVLSRWAKMKIFSQFSAEFLDGRKSFIFSWEKKHRLIHEDALIHFLDGAKEGETFEPVSRPPPKPEKVNEESEETVPVAGYSEPIKHDASFKEHLVLHVEPEERNETTNLLEEVSVERSRRPTRNVFILSYRLNRNDNDPTQAMMTCFTAVANKLGFAVEYSFSPDREILDVKKQEHQEYVILLVDRNVFENEKGIINSLLAKADRKSGCRSVIVISNDRDWKAGQHISEGVQQSFDVGNTTVLSWNENDLHFSTNPHEEFLEKQLKEARGEKQTTVVGFSPGQRSRGWFWWLHCIIL